VARGGAGHGGNVAGTVSSTTGALLSVRRGGANGIGLDGALNGAANATAVLSRGAQSAMAGGSASGNGSANAHAGRHHAGASGSASADGSGSIIGLGLGNGGVGAPGLGQLPRGVQIINGVPCGPDGRPLTGAAATAVMAALSGKGMHQGSPSNHDSASAPSTSSSAPRATPPQSQSASRTPTRSTSTPAAYGERHPQVSH
jgi:hypothetical protein